MKRVLFVTNVPSPYRVNFFNELGKKCELTVFFEKSNSTERDSSWKEYNFNNFKGIILKGKSYNTDSAFCPSIIKEFKKNSYDEIVICNFSSLTGIYFTNYLIKHKIPYVIESDGGFAPVNLKGLKVNIKKKIFQNAKYCLATSEEHKKYYELGNSEQVKTLIYPFSSIYESDVVFDKNIYKNKLREIHNISLNELVLVSVGQFIFRKGYDILFKALKNIKNVRLFVIGGEPTDEYIKIIKDLELENIEFISFKKKKELFDYLILSDLFVFPTREDIWGLVINEALACGLPIISSDKCLSAVEISKYTNGIQLFESENVDQLHNMIFEVCSNKDKLNVMSQNNILIAKKYTIETMVNSHVELLNL